MSHSDDVGLVLPPKVAPVQVAVVALRSSRVPSSNKDVLEKAAAIVSQLKAASIRAVLDDDATESYGARIYAWERKGVPLRISVGPKEVTASELSVVSRDGTTVKVSSADLTALPASLQMLLTSFHDRLLARATTRLDGNIHEADSFASVKASIAQHDASGSISSPWFSAPWRESAANEELVKAETKYTIRCMTPLPPDSTRVCMLSGQPATHQALFARAF